MMFSVMLGASRMNHESMDKALHGCAAERRRKQRGPGDATLNAGYDGCLEIPGTVLTCVAKRA